MTSLTSNAASAPKPSQRAKPRPFGTGTPRARGPSARRPPSSPRSLDSLGLYVHSTLRVAVSQTVTFPSVAAANVLPSGAIATPFPSATPTV